ncbi:MAG: hypothetical protein MPJ50_10765 [Pirellulales bacterium]|nr:hypothetical protein [Pirellulales bacterium]
MSRLLLLFVAITAAAVSGCGESASVDKPAPKIAPTSAADDVGGYDPRDGDVTVESMKAG